MTPDDAAIGGEIVFALVMAVFAIFIAGTVTLAVADWLDRCTPAPGSMCDDDGTGQCSGCQEIGDGAVAMTTGPSDAEIERMIRSYRKRGGRG